MHRAGHPGRGSDLEQFIPAMRTGLGCLPGRVQAQPKAGTAQLDRTGRGPEGRVRRGRSVELSLSSSMRRRGCAHIYPWEEPMSSVRQHVHATVIVVVLILVPALALIPWKSPLLQDGALDLPIQAIFG